MSHVSQHARRLAIAGVSALALAGAAAPTASAAQVNTHTFKCKYPLLGVNPVSVRFTFDLPDEWPVGKPLEPSNVTAEVTAGGNTVPGLALIQGFSALEGDANVLAKGFNGATGVDVKIPLKLTKYTLPTPVPDPLELIGTGKTPALTFDTPGEFRLGIEGFGLNLKATNAAGETIVLPPVTRNIDNLPVTETDMEVETFDVYCKIDAGQNTTLAQINVVPDVEPTTPNPPITVTPRADNANSVYLCWTHPTPDYVAYDIYRDDTLVTTWPAAELSHCARVFGLSPETTYEFKVVPKLANGASGPAATVSATTLALAPDVVGAFDVAGSAQLKNLVKGNVPLKGGAVLRFPGGSPTVVGDSLTLAPTQARLIGLGFLPVTAKLAFVSSGSLSGSLAGFAGPFLFQKVRIKVLEAKLFGAIPLAGGNNCQTKSLTTLALNSDSFTLAKGGTFTGEFTISDLNGCGALNGLVSPVVAGAGNTISLNLTPKG